MRFSVKCAAVGLTLAFVTAASPAWAGCDPEDKPDKTTATDARKRLEAAGYRQVSDLKKGCDNVWHGRATKDGAAVSVIVTAQGQVMLETNP
ncbi:MAG: PepSY domain-containing protein [Alphaproteobacteria bacterium]|nr:PepSY domain-containing protein [Alphaproteobacteria bacterium]